MRTISIFACLCALALGTVLSCGGSREKQLADAVAAFRAKGTEDARARLEASLMNLVTLKDFGPEAVSAGGLVFTRRSEGLRLLWPRVTAVDLSPDFVISACDPVRGRCAFSNGKEVRIFNPGGSRAGTLSIGGVEPVTGLLLSEDRVLFLQNGFLWRAVIDAAPERAVEGAVVSAPKLGISLRSVMIGRGDRVAVNAGNAGIYNLSVVDLKEKKALLRDFPIAASKFGFDGETLWCVTGSTGNWSVVKYGISSKKTEVLHRYPVLLDVEFSGGLMLAESDRGVSLLGLKDGDFIALPFACELAGSAGEGPVLFWKGSRRLVDGPLLFDVVKRLRGELPALFAAPK